MDGTGPTLHERQLWLPAVDQDMRSPVTPWPLPPQSVRAAPEPPRLELVEVTYPCDAWLWGDWPNLERQQRVRVVGETATMLRIEACERTRAPGQRWLEAGDTALVPRSAVAFEAPLS